MGNGSCRFKCAPVVQGDKFLSQSNVPLDRRVISCCLYTSDAADEGLEVDLDSRRTLKQKVNVSVPFQAAPVVQGGKLVSKYNEHRHRRVLSFYIYKCAAVTQGPNH